MTQSKRSRRAKKVVEKRFRLTAYVLRRDAEIVKRACLITDKTISTLVKEATVKEAARIIAEHNQPNGEDRPRILGSF